MFYTITKHLFKTLLSFFLVVTGFAYGFFIIHFQSGNDKFENFGKAFLKTLVMSTGEFDFDDVSILLFNSLYKVNSVQEA